MTSTCCRVVWSAKESIDNTCTYFNLVQCMRRNTEPCFSVRTYVSNFRQVFRKVLTIVGAGWMVHKSRANNRQFQIVYGRNDLLACEFKREPEV